MYLVLVALNCSSQLFLYFESLSKKVLLYWAGRGQVCYVLLNRGIVRKKIHNALHIFDDIIYVNKE